MPEDAPLDAADAFGVLADETRVRILQALGDAWVDDWPGVLPYSTLMSRVGAEDSGRFHYHLSRLVGRFVVKRDDGYKLDFTGLTLYRAIHAGTFTEASQRGPFDADCACHACDGRLEARYSGDVFVVECPDCESRFCEAAVPPGTAGDCSQSALLAVADSLERNYLRLAVDGVCPWCTGGMQVAVLDVADSELDPSAAQSFHARHTCQRCGGRVWQPVGFHALVDPLVVGVLVAEGVDARSRPFWEFALAVTDEHTAVLERNPWRFAVTLPGAGGQTAVVGPDLRVDRLD